jgi:hypothetical protein
MTGKLAQARPSRSQRCYRVWGHDQTSSGVTLVAASTPGRSDPDDLSHLAEPNASDLEVRITQPRRKARKTSVAAATRSIGDNIGDSSRPLLPAL